jgi:hypothetical protein
MIEVFKTNVQNGNDAGMLIGQIHKNFSAYTANFDLEDRDKVLRIQCDQGMIKYRLVIALLKESGFDAEVLPDEVPGTNS